jgi:hypothetical protein
MWMHISLSTNLFYLMVNGDGLVTTSSFVRINHPFNYEAFDFSDGGSCIVVRRRSVRRGLATRQVDVIKLAADTRQFVG